MSGSEYRAPGIAGELSMMFVEPIIGLLAKVIGAVAGILDRVLDLIVCRLYGHWWSEAWWIPRPQPSGTTSMLCRRCGDRTESTLRLNEFKQATGKRYRHPRAYEGTWVRVKDDHWIEVRNTRNGHWDDPSRCTPGCSVCSARATD